MRSNPEFAFHRQKCNWICCRYGTTAATQFCSFHTSTCVTVNESHSHTTARNM